MSELVPVLVTVRGQLPLPLVRLPVQLPPVEFVTVTVPVGTGFPVEGALAVTWRFTVMVCPATALVCGELTVVDEVACETTRPTDVLLLLKLLSPP